MRHGMRIGTVLIAILLCGSVGGRVHAQAANEAFTLQPGGKATVQFESFCIDYGKKFPETIGLPPTGVAEVNVAGALNYALGKGFTGSQPKEVQFAIWQARGAQGSPATGAQGQEISANATTQPTPPAGATSLIDALTSNQIRATAGKWEGIGEKLTINNFEDNFQGQGELMIENTSGQALTLYMPVGTLFPAPSAEFQSMAGYATKVDVTNPVTQTLPDTGISALGIQTTLLALFGTGLVAYGWQVRRRIRA